MKFTGLLTDAQKRAGLFVAQDEDFIYLFRRNSGKAEPIAVFLYETATVKEIRDKAEEQLNGTDKGTGDSK